MIVSPGALVDGSVGFFYRGTTLQNDGAINTGSFIVGTSAPQTISGIGSIATFLPYTFDPGGITITGEQTITSQLAFNYGNAPIWAEFPTDCRSG